MIAEQLQKLDPVVKQRAHLWSRRGAGDPQELEQEGRLALLAALPKFRPGGDLRGYGRGVLDKRFGNALRELLRWKRRPHITDRTATGERRSIPCPTLSIEQPRKEYDPDYLSLVEHIPAQGLDPEETALRAEHLRRISQVMTHVRERLTSAERTILDAYVSPPAALLVTARNLGTGNHAEISQIALFLGVTHSTVDAALRRCRRLAASILWELEE